MKEKISLALGYFDCVHVGHRRIINYVKDFGRGTPAVFTFKNDMRDFFGKGKSIYSFIERKSILDKLGVKVIAETCDIQFAKQNKKEFLDALFEKYDIKLIACGSDYTFGAQGSGNATFLSEYVKDKDCTLKVFDDIRFCDKRISATCIKEFLSAGDVMTATVLLGENYFKFGKVIGGKGRGHIFGFPTANFEFETPLTLKEGVYATVCEIDKEKFYSVTNVGEKPTFADFSLSVETMISDFDRNIYGKTVKLDFIKFIRPIKKFASPESLREQICADMEVAKKC